MSKYDYYLEKGNKVLGKLARKLTKDGYKENFGQKEARKFNDEVMKASSNGELSHQEAAELSVDMFEGVLNL